MKEQATICVAYTGEAVNDGTMDINELAPALLALSNLISEANRTLNNDDSKIEVRLSAHFERGSFEMSLELIRDLPAQIKFLLFDSSYSLNEILGAIGLFCTISGGTLIEFYRFIKGRKVTKVEKIDKDRLKVFINEESHEVSFLAWRLFSSQKARRYVEGIVHPLKKDGVDGLDFRDADNKQVIERITENEVEYFSEFAKSDELQEIVSSQELMLQILKVNFERGLKWRFDDGNAKFYADVVDEKFLDAVEAGRISFGYGDVILATVETKQQHVNGEIRNTTKSVVKVLRISKRAEQINLFQDETEE